MAHPAPLSAAWFKIVRGDLSQVKVAKKIGVSRQTWHSWESGQANPRVKQLPVLMRLAESLGNNRNASSHETSEALRSANANASAPELPSGPASPHEADLNQQLLSTIAQLSFSRRLSLLVDLVSEIAQNKRPG